MQDLVREVDPTEQLDEEVEEMLLQLADDFVETTVNAACLLAKHRHANTVEVKDVQLHLGELPIAPRGIFVDEIWKRLIILYSDLQKEIGTCGFLVLVQTKYVLTSELLSPKLTNKD